MSQPVLVLDPGHGGRDPGAVGRRVREKDINLQLCLLLRDLLVRAGVKVIMTRDRDVWPSGASTTGQDLAYRAKIANDANADLFVSWHYDSAEDPRAHGCAVWIHPTQKNKAAHHKASKLAYSISTCADQKNRGVYFSNFQVLLNTEMDALLVEGGFLTNSVEESRLTDVTFLKKQAEGAAQALCQILGVAYVAPQAKEPVNGLAAAIETMQAKGVRIHPPYWLENAVPGRECRGDYVGLVFQRAAAALTGNFVHCTSDAVRILKDAGVQVDADYWLPNAQAGKICRGEHVATIFERIAANL